MEIEKTTEGKVLNISLSGKLDVLTAPLMEKELSAAMEGIEELRLNMERLEYISSVGLKTLLNLHKKMILHGEMVVKNVNAEIMSLFEISGFSDILTIE